jgi:hypothetical protein
MTHLNWRAFEAGLHGKKPEKSTLSYDTASSDF